MHFTKVVPSIFYADIRVALRTFINCLECTMGHEDLHASTPFCVVDKDGLSIMLFQDAAYAEKEHPEIRLVTNNIDEVFTKVSTEFPELLHPNLKEISLRPWGAMEFAMLDGQIGIRVQQWPSRVKHKKEYMLPYFGPIDVVSLKDYYHTNIAFPDHDYIIRLGLHFTNKQITQSEADDIATFLSGLEDLDKQNLLAIEKDFIDRSGETYDYIQFYLEELGKKKLAKIIGKKKDKTPIEKKLLQKLRLVSLSLYPDGRDSDAFGIFDYSIDIDGKPSNQVLAVKTGKGGRPVEIDWES